MTSVLAISSGTIAAIVVIVVIGLSLGTITGRFALPPTTGPAVAMLLLWFTIGYVFYSTGLAVLGGSAYLWYRQTNEPEQEREPEV